MTPTRRRTLVAVAVLIGALTWGLVHVLDSSGDASGIPAVPWSGPVGLLLLAVGIAALAVSLRSRLRGDVGTKPVPALAAARMVVLAKATSHTGAVLCGLYLGLAAFVLVDIGLSSTAARSLTALAGVIASVLLTTAGLALERVLRLPDDDVPLDPTAPAGDVAR